MVDPETERIRALHGYDVLDTPPEPCFDRLTRSAARLFGARYAFLSLVDGNRVFLKSCHGAQCQDVPREFSFCSRAITSSAPLIVLDATQDSRFAQNPFVTGSPGVRFYLGVPLVMSGDLRIGTLCVVDVEPRPSVSDRELSILCDLAEETVDQIEHRVTRRNSTLYADALEQRNREFKEQESRWSKSEARAALALEAGEMGYWEWDAATDRAYWSPRMEHIFGMRPGAYDGSYASWVRCLHPEDRTRVYEEVLRLRLTESAFFLKYRILHPDGSTRWVTEKGSYQRDANGQMLGAIGICWDATERETRYTELCASEELFRGLSVSCPAGIFKAQLDGRVTYVNPGTASIWAMTEEEILGFGWLPRVHADDRELLLNGWLEANRNGCDYDLEYRLILPGGEVRWVHGRSAIIHDLSGSPIGTVGTVDDITDRKNAEHALQEAKTEAEAANRSKDLFLANISHELRTPLNGILGASELLRHSRLSAEQREHAETVWHCGESLLSVVQDVLDISKIEAGTLKVVSAPFDLRVTVNRASALFQKQAAAKGLQFETVYDGDSPSRFLGDTDRIQQILLNFLGNAVKFTERGGIRCQVSVQQATPDNCRVTVAVSDTGPGISEESQTKLFQPFSQVDTSSTRRYGGVGLGLAISRRLSELMGGSVGVHSSAGSGSTFWLNLDLPVDSSTPALEAIQSEQYTRITRSEPGRVLVAEDNAVNQRVVKHMLQRLGWQVDVAADGAVAIELAQRNPYTLILMDCQMPELDGYTAASCIRTYESRNRRPRVPIVAITANAMSGERERCLAAGMDDYLAKPLQLEQLRQTLERWSTFRSTGQDEYLSSLINS